MTLQTIDLAPIAEAVQEKQKAEAAIKEYGDTLASRIAGYARELGVMSDNVGRIELPRGYSVEVFYGDARLRWPRPFLPTGEKLMQDLSDGWLDNVTSHLKSARKVQK